MVSILIRKSIKATLESSIHSKYTYLNGFWISNFGMEEQLSSLFIIPVFWHNVFAFVDVFEDIFDTFELLNQFDGTFWSDTTNRFAVIATKQDAQIDEL